MSSNENDWLVHKLEEYLDESEHQPNAEANHLKNNFLFFALTHRIDPVTINSDSAWSKLIHFQRELMQHKGRAAPPLRHQNHLALWHVGTDLERHEEHSKLSAPHLWLNEW